MKKYAKLLALLLAVVMVVSMFAACGDKTPASSTPGSSTPDASTPSSTPDETPEVPEEPATYTYNYAMSEFPTVWNIHNYETATDAEIADYIVSGFYTFDYNENLDGYQMVTSMAAEFPIDVTADYIGQYGLAEGAESQAYIIKLREDLKWEDGTPINANDFVESYKRLMNPDAQNYRADGLYSSSLVIHGAKDYLYAGKTVKSDNGATGALTMEDLVLGEDGVYTTADGGIVYLGLAYPLDWTGGNSLADYVGAYGDAYFDVTNWDALIALADEEGLVPMTDEVYELFLPVVTGNPAWGETEADAPNYFVYEETYPEMSWDEVGWQALSDYEILMVIDKPLSGFYLNYALTSSYLVNIELYDSCIEYVDGVYTNTYGTTAETTMSYGPYKLTSFQADKQYVLERNEYYFNLTEDTYQTTHIVVDYVPEATTRLELFLQGKLDSYGLTIDDMATYQMSDHTYYTPGDSIFMMVFNPDLSALEANQATAGENKNKTILTVSEFRQAMSFAMDRNAFALATSPTNAPAFALFSELIISDPENGTAYRATDEAKNTMANFWGVSEEYGEGKLYADIDEAIESITGYNLEKAKQMFDAAYDIAIAEGLMDEDDVIEICVGTPNNTSAFYNNGYEYIVNNYTEAVKGTKLEGKLTFTRDDTLGNGFADALKNNQVDMLFGVGWTGSALDPYGLMEVYVSQNYQYDDSWDASTVQMVMNIGGVDYTASLYDWYAAMNGSVVTLTEVVEEGAEAATIEYSCGSADNDPETRLQILAALENAVLMNYNNLPLIGDASASMKGMQIQYYTEDYVFGMGRGGVQYYTYNYTDAEWDAFVAENGNMLDYT